jgi:hypothetical protein
MNTLNNISVISWRTILLVEETGVLGETTDLPQVIDKLMMLYLVHLGWTRLQLIALVVIGTDCMGICKTNYHTMTTTTTPHTPINSAAFFYLCGIRTVPTVWYYNCSDSVVLELFRQCGIYDDDHDDPSYAH